MKKHLILVLILLLAAVPLYPQTAGAKRSEIKTKSVTKPKYKKKVIAGKVRCAGINKNKKQCRRWTSDPTGKCFQHRK
jgi:hypothetical protein